MVLRTSEIVTHSTDNQVLNELKQTIKCKYKMFTARSLSLSLSISSLLLLENICAIYLSKCWLSHIQCSKNSVLFQKI